MKLIINESQLQKIVDIISESSSDKKYNVLFVGDSLSSGVGYTWNYVLEELHPEWNVDHVYKSGQTTGWMLKQLKLKLSEKKYDLVFIWGGTNDMFSAAVNENIIPQDIINTAISNLTEMTNDVIKQDGKPIIFAGNDIVPIIKRGEMKPSYSKTGKLICGEDCISKFKNAMVLFQNRLEQGIPGAYVVPRIKDSNLKTWDGTHVDVEGHKMIANHIDEEIPKIIQGVQKVESKSIPKDSWINILGGLLTQVFSYFFGSGDNLTEKLIRDLDKLKSVSDLEFKPGFIKYNQDVEPIQVALKLLDYPFPKFGIDGKFGPETEKAIKLFQKDNDLKLTGKINSDLITRLIAQIKSNNFTDKDFKDLNLKEIKDLSGDLSDETIQNYNIDGEFTSKLTSSTLNKFKKVLDKENIDYNDFTNKVKKIGLDPNVAIQQLAVESINFMPEVINCKIKSPMGAKGIAQFIPSTEAQYNIDACKVDQSLNAYVKLMDYNLKRFKGRVDLAVAGYNSGPFLKYNNKEVYMEALKNNTPFSELKNLVPAETWGYVNNILSI